MTSSMVNHDEQHALTEFIALKWTGRGEIVEIGSFVGGSAIAIMQGMKKTGKRGRLHVYDTFLFPKNDLEPIFRGMVPQCKVASFRSVFDENTRDWQDWLDVTEGDAAQAKWDGRVIFFMHIDCSISQAFHEAIARTFYPNLWAGSVIAHQDYDYARAPFIAQMMTKLRPWFGSFMHVSTTMYFRCLKAPTRMELEEALADKDLVPV